MELLLELLEHRLLCRAIGGAARHPGSQGGAGPRLGHQGIDDHLAQRVERLRVAEEVGDADEQVADQGLLLADVSAQVIEVGVGVLEARQGHPPEHAALDGGRLVDPEIEAQVGLEDRGEAAEILFVDAQEPARTHVVVPVDLGLEGGRDTRTQREVGEALQGGRDLVDREDQVDDSGVDRALRHAGLATRVGILGHGEATRGGLARRPGAAVCPSRRCSLPPGG